MKATAATAWSPPASSRAKPSCAASVSVRLGKTFDGMELWDSAFHRTIAATAGNSLMLTLFDVVDQIRQMPFWRRPRGQDDLGQSVKSAVLG